MDFRRLARSVSLRLAPAVWMPFLSESISSLIALSWVRLGSYFFCRSAKFRWPSLVCMTAGWNMMTAIFVGPAGATAVVDAVLGAGSVVAALPVWARALTP